MSNSERMAPADTTWLRMDQPTNPMVIVGVLMLEGPVDLQILEQSIAARLLAFARFRQRIEQRPTGLYWSDDPHFNIERHIKHVRLPGREGRAELEDFIADLASQPLDMSRPPWQFHIVERYDRGVALVARVHHAIADGIALIGIVLSMTDSRPDAAARTPAAADATAGREDHDDGYGLLGPLTDLMEEGLRVSSEVWREALARAADPADALKEGAGIAGELAHMLLMPDDSPTRLKGTPSGDKKVAWSDPLALSEVKAVSRVLGCSVNDILLAAVAGALHRYLEDKGDRTTDVEVRALVPVNLRPRGEGLELGNHFGIVAIELPVGLDSPLSRVHEVHRRMEALKSSYEPPVTLALMAALGYAPEVVQDWLLEFLLGRATAVMTNVPGPQHPRYLAGARIKQAMFWVPQPGDIAVGVSILSFDGQVQFGLMTDAAVVPDPGAIVARFGPEFEKLLYFVLMEDWVLPASEGAAERKEGARGPAGGLASERKGSTS